MFDNRHPDDGVDDAVHDAREQISWFRSLGDREALFQFLEGERQTERGLQAAEALVELGDVRGLDHLIASLRSSNSAVRHQAAQVLKDINHPRGLRALRDFRDEPGLPTAATIGAQPDVSRQKLHDDLKALDTDELVALWHEQDRSSISALALEVLSGILMERLGRLPPEEAEAADQIDEDVDPRIQDLWIQGDTGGLMRIFEDTSDVRLQLEVAEALADLGDEDALGILIEALDDPDRQINEMAAGILDWLDLPRGNRALEDRGIEFEADAKDLFSETESQPAVSAAPIPSEPTDARASAAPLRPAARLQQPPAARPLEAQIAGQQWESSASPAAALLVGAVGGLVGFIIFMFGLDVLGFLPLPTDMGGWIQPPALYYLGASILAGAASGGAGSRVAQAIGRRFGWEPAEGDLLPVLGALFEGATSAVVVNFFMHSILRL